MRLYNKYLLTLVSLATIVVGLVIANIAIRNNESHSVLIGDNQKPKTVVYYEGDIVFQNSTSSNCMMMRKLTHCDWNQIGILFSRNNEWYVYEADNQVKYVRFSEWIDNGNEGRFAVKRLKNSDKILNDTVIEKLKDLADEYFGRDYDLFFSNDDTRMYNSELVYKMYLRAVGVRLGNMRPINSFDVTNPEVEKYIRIKYPETIPNDSTMISTQEIFNSDKLLTVYASE